MEINQFVYLKESADYTEVFDAPVFAGKSIGVTSGYLGKITALNIKGIGDAHLFTKILNAYDEEKYLDNKDISLYEFSDVSPDGTKVPSAGTSTNSGGTFNKILGIFSGLIGIFGKSSTKLPTNTDTPTKPENPTTQNPEEKEKPTTGNTDKKTFAEWFSANWWWAIGVFVIVFGGIIWAIVAAVKSYKKKKALKQANVVQLPTQ